MLSIDEIEEQDANELQAPAAAKHIARPMRIPTVFIAVVRAHLFRIYTLYGYSSITVRGYMPRIGAATFEPSQMIEDGDPVRPARSARSAVFGQQRIHFGDLGLLVDDDPAAQILDARVPDGAFPAHQHGGGVVGDHRTQKLAVADGRLCPDRQKRQNENGAARDQGDRVEPAAFTCAPSGRVRLRPSGPPSEPPCRPD